MEGPWGGAQPAEKSCGGELTGRKGAAGLECERKDQGRGKFEAQEWLQGKKRSPEARPGTLITVYAATTR